MLLLLLMAFKCLWSWHKNWKEAHLFPIANRICSRSKLRIVCCHRLQTLSAPSFSLMLRVDKILISISFGIEFMSILWVACMSSHDDDVDVDEDIIKCLLVSFFWLDFNLLLIWFFFDFYVHRKKMFWMQFHYNQMNVDANVDQHVVRICLYSFDFEFEK